MFKDRIAECAGKITLWIGHMATIGFGQEAIKPARLCLMEGAMPRVEANVNRLVEGQRSEVTVAAAHVQRGSGQVEGLVIGCFHTAQESAEVRQVTEVEIEVIFVRHDIMIALFQKVIAGAFL
jgi:hypothetical protein